MLAPLIQELEAQWRAVGYVPTIVQGPSGDDVRRALRAAGFPAPLEIVEWFSWMGGTRQPRELIIPALMRPLGLFESISETRRLGEVLSATGVEPGEWAPNWLVMDLDAASAVFELREGHDEVVVREFSVDSREFQLEVASRSIGEMLNAWITGLKACPLDVLFECSKQLPVAVLRAGLGPWESLDDDTLERLGRNAQ